MTAYAAKQCSRVGHSVGTAVVVNSVSLQSAKHVIFELDVSLSTRFQFTTLTRKQVRNIPGV